MENNNGMLKGTIYVTDDINFVHSVPDKSVKIISLDEDFRLNPDDPSVIVGICLLPPIESLIAEADGDEDLYNIHYINHLNSPFNREFIGALIAALYKGISLLLYAPHMNDTVAIRKLRQNLWSMYGIMIGVVGGEPNQFDPRCIPIWLTMIYSANVISPEEFLLNYPADASVNNIILNKLMADMKPFGESYNQRVDVLRNHQLRLKENPKVKLAIFDTRM